MNNGISVLLPEEVATLLKTTLEAVIAEMEAGRLKAFRIGDEWRTTQQYVMEMISTAVDAASIVPVQSAASPTVGPDTKGVPTLDQLKALQWKKLDGGIKYQWPHKADDPEGTNLESYDEVYQSTLDLDGRTESFVIAFGNRPSAGMNDRRRAVVFHGEIGRTLYPKVEFSGANDFAASGLMVSIIRSDGRKPVRMGDALPADYELMPTALYNHIVVGPRAWNCIAVVAHKTDFSVMLRHAILRMHGH
jgi:hypothetical protein